MLSCQGLYFLEELLRPVSDLSLARNRLSFMRSILPGVTPRYFGSEWSFAQVLTSPALRPLLPTRFREHPSSVAATLTLFSSLCA